MLVKRISHIGLSKLMNMIIISFPKILLAFNLCLS